VLGLGFRWRADALRADAVRRWETSLGAVADAAKLAVTKWVEERLADSRIVAAYAATVPELLSAAGRPSGLSRARATERVQRHLTLARDAYGYLGQWVLDRSGRVAVQLPGEQGPVAQFMYQDKSGQRLTLYIKTDTSSEKETAFRFAQEGSVGVFYWIDRRLSYALSGEVKKEDLLKVANAVYRKLNP